ASVDDRATVRCFRESHGIGLPPKKIMYTEVDVRSSLFPPQSASEYNNKLFATAFRNMRP
ncbi:hypothetical protein A2U01_0118048, partial [Trifolium medium]|nr:hypothetical protein [Trifolium medium]